MSQHERYLFDIKTEQVPLMFRVKVYPAVTNDVNLIYCFRLQPQIVSGVEKGVVTHNALPGTASVCRPQNLQIYSKSDLKRDSCTTPLQQMTVHAEIRLTRQSLKSIFHAH